MRRRLFFLFFFIGTFLNAQEVDRGMIWAKNGLGSNKIVLEKFSIPKEIPGRNILVLETPFAKAEFIAPLLASAAKNKLIEKVQLVYTTFKLFETFDQQKLNQQRLQNLHSLLSDAFSNPLTEWELVAQTGAHSPEEGKNYFHGFVIVWRPNASTELIEREMKNLDSIFSKNKLIGEVMDSSVKFGSKELILPNGKKIELDHKIPEDSLWQYIESGNPSTSIIDAKYGAGDSIVIVTILAENGYRVKHSWKLEEHKGKLKTGIEGVDPNFRDSVFSNVMRRNNFQKMVLIVDVTGSMSPYTTQVFCWIPYGISSGKCSQFVFFNDGNKKSTGEKSIGKTGGIYGIQSMRFDSVYATAKQTMANGDGGDLSENPVEATIWGIKKWNPQGDVVLVADNYSSPRDLELYKKLDRPIHIILCGAEVMVNPDYLFLARETHGSVHTLTEDVTGLDKMQDGEVVVIGGKHYELHGEKFLCLEMFSNTVH